jgi:lactate dehydrogenase-like 2-hydroxyacid dehydrogenase
MVVGSSKRIGWVAPGSEYTLTASLAPRTSDIPSGRDATSRVSAAVVVDADVVVGAGRVVVGTIATVVVVTIGAVSLLGADEQAANIAKTRASTTRRRISGDGIGTLRFGLFMKVDVPRLASRSMSRVLVSDVIPADILEPLAALAEIEMWDQEGRAPRSWVLDHLRGCDGWLSMLSDRIDAELLSTVEGLRVISQMSVGVDNIDVDACRDQGITVGHTPDVLTEATADTAFTLMAAVVRRIPEAARIVKAGEWGPWDPWHFLSGDLHGATLGILGMGRIGQAIARRARGFDMKVLYASRSPKEISGAEPVDLAGLLARSDIVVIAVGLDHETRGMIGTAELNAMKDTAYLVNVARGPIVDSDALVEALAEGRIGGAALDVTDPEPLPPDHPLLEFPNCLVVPHIGSATLPARRAMAALAVANLTAYLRGEPMPAWLPGSARQPDAD